MPKLVALFQKSDKAQFILQAISNQLPQIEKYIPLVAVLNQSLPNSQYPMNALDHFSLANMCDTQPAAFIRYVGTSPDSNALLTRVFYGQMISKNFVDHFCSSLTEPELAKGIDKIVAFINETYDPNEKITLY